MRRRILFFIPIFWIALISAANSGPGVVDPEFNYPDGFVMYGHAEYNYFGYDMAIQPDGKIVVVGIESPIIYEAHGHMKVWRYQPDGSLDFEFGVDGVSSLGYGRLNAVTVQPDGKIVLAGSTSQLCSGRAFVRRLNPNGSADTSFGNQGVLFNEFWLESHGKAIFIQDDGKIVTAGHGKKDPADVCLSSYNDSPWITRYHPDGSSDTGFGINGMVEGERHGHGDYRLQDMDIQEDGKILITGFTFYPQSPFGWESIWTYRYHSDGTKDLSYNGGLGYVGYHGEGLYVPGKYNAYSMALQKDGKIVIGGLAESDKGIRRGLLLRYDSEGKLDSGFGSNGIVTYLIPYSPYFVYPFDNCSVAIQDDGKILAISSPNLTSVSPNHDIPVLRYNPDGSPDMGFGQNGIAIYNDSDPVWNYCNAIGIHNNGKIVVAGQKYDSLVYKKRLLKIIQFTGDLPDSCDSWASSQHYEWITSVKGAGVTNDSGASPYTDYTYHDITFKMPQNSNNFFTLTPGYSSNAYLEHWRVWIDWNHDGDFGDPGEQVFEAADSGRINLIIQVPRFAQLGKTRMRISMKYAAYPEPCGNFQYGETEDYMVQITPMN